MGDNVTINGQGVWGIFNANGTRENYVKFLVSRRKQRACNQRLKKGGPNLMPKRLAGAVGSPPQTRVRGQPPPGNFEIQVISCTLVLCEELCYMFIPDPMTLCNIRFNNIQVFLKVSNNTVQYTSHCSLLLL